MSNKNDARRLWGRRTSQLTPYVPGEQPRDRVFLKLNTNENPYPPAPAVEQAIRAFPTERFRLYPDPGSHELRNCLSDYFGLSMDRIFVGNGSDEILAIAFQAFFNNRTDLIRLAGGSDLNVEPADADCIVFPDVTYSFYPVYARMYDIPYRTVALDENFQLPLDECRVPSAGLILANPNAPTGIAVDLDVIADLAAADRNRLILVDEAYVDFGADSAVSLLDQFDNILVVQTCSKSRSLAGLRVAFALGAPALIEALERVRDSFNSYTLDCLGQTAAIAAFNANEWFETSRAKIIAARQSTAQTLQELGFEVLPSGANFLFVRHPQISGGQLYQQLRDEGILVRHFKLPRIENFLRITIGRAEDMLRLTDTLRRLVSDC